MLLQMQLSPILFDWFVEKENETHTTKKGAVQLMHKLE